MTPHCCAAVHRFFAPVSPVVAAARGYAGPPPARRRIWADRRDTIKNTPPEAGREARAANLDALFGRATEPRRPWARAATGGARRRRRGVAQGNPEFRSAEGLDDQGDDIQTPAAEHDDPRAPTRRRYSVDARGSGDRRVRAELVGAPCPPCQFDDESGRSRASSSCRREGAAGSSEAHEAQAARNAPGRCLSRRSRERPVLIHPRRPGTSTLHARDQLLQPIPIFSRS